MPAGEDLREVWCVVTENKGVTIRWVVPNSELMVGIYQGASQANFEKYGCENWE